MYACLNLQGDDIIKFINKFWIYLKQNLKPLIFMFLLTGLNQICYLFLPKLMADLIDVGIIHNINKDSFLLGMSADEIVLNQTSYILKIGLLMLLITFLSVIITIIINRIMTKISSNISMNLRKDIFHKIMNISYYQASKFSSASLITRSTRDVEKVQSFIMMLTQIIVPPFMMIGGIIMSFQVCQSLTWLIIFGSVVSGAIAFSCLKIITSKAKILQQTEDDFNLTVKEQLDGVAIIRGFGNLSFEQKRFEKSNLKFASISFFINKVTSIMSPLLTLSANLLSVLVLWFSSVRVSKSIMEVGQVVALIQYAIMIIGAFVIISLMISAVPRSIISVKRVSEILDCKEENQDDLKHLSKDFKGKIEFKNVSFKYFENESYATKNINFTANPGEVIGIMGPVGSGKTTFLKLIMGLYNASEGEIFFENENLKNFNKKSILESISYVSQKDSLFSGTVKSNLMLGNKNVGVDDMKEVLKIVDLEKFSSDEGLNSKILQHGKNISGGQKQRLTIARALLKDSNIYIFDDIFSNLDFKTEYLIKNRILERLKGKTIFLVSGRVGTLKDTNKILIFDGGKIIAEGSHEKLKKECEIYREMVKLQLGGEISNE